MAKLNKIKPDTILKNFWKNNDRFADLFNACFFDGNPKLNPDDLTEVDTDVSSLLQFHGYAETLNADENFPGFSYPIFNAIS